MGGGSFMLAFKSEGKNGALVASAVSERISFYLMLLALRF